jgi:hypothetical protein
MMQPQMMQQQMMPQQMMQQPVQPQSFANFTVSNARERAPKQSKRPRPTN